LSSDVPKSFVCAPAGEGKTQSDSAAAAGTPTSVPRKKGKEELLKDLFVGSLKFPPTASRSRYSAGEAERREKAAMDLPEFPNNSMVEVEWPDGEVYPGLLLRYFWSDRYLVSVEGGEGVVPTTKKSHFKTTDPF